MTRLFGTNGVRGIANRDLDAELAMRLGQAIGSWLPKGSTVALARDARTSGPMLAAAAAAGLLSTGMRVVRLGVTPTPAAQFYVKSHADVKAGLVVTASHNPPEFNGLKLIAGDGTEASRDEEEAVEALFFSKKFRIVAWNELGPLAEDASANESYIEAVLSRVNVPAIQKRQARVVLDTGGGPGSLTSLPILNRLGCEVTTVFEALDGEFKGRKSEPTPDNLTRLIQTVKTTKADLGVAHDGDADRCIFVDASGTWVSGDISLALLCGSALRKNRGGAICTPVATSALLDDVASMNGGKVVRTAVGSPIVARAMLEQKLTIGGEENGGVIFPDHQYCRDAAMTMAKMLELLATEGRSLSELVAALPRFHQTKLKFPVPPERKDGLLAQLRAWVANEYPKAKVDTTDGLKVQTPEGWVLIRASGTEPIFRVFAESKEKAWADAAAKRFVEAGQQLTTVRA